MKNLIFILQDKNLLLLRNRGSFKSLSETKEMLLDYYTGIELIRGYSFRGDLVQYEVSWSELLRQGRVIFGFSDGEGNNVGGFTLGERKFWGWYCYAYMECDADNGEVNPCAICDYYVFWVRVRKGVIRLVM